MSYPPSASRQSQGGGLPRRRMRHVAVGPLGGRGDGGPPTVTKRVLVRVAEVFTGLHVREQAVRILSSPPGDEGGGGVCRSEARERRTVCCDRSLAIFRGPYRVPVEPRPKPGARLWRVCLSEVPTSSSRRRRPARRVCAARSAIFRSIELQYHCGSGRRPSGRWPSTSKQSWANTLGGPGVRPPGGLSEVCVCRPVGGQTPRCWSERAPPPYTPGPGQDRPKTAPRRGLE